MTYRYHPIPHEPRDAGFTYVAGPMSGHLEWNYPAFIDMAESLRGLGFKVIAPHELHDPDSGLPWDWFLRRDLEQLIKCSRLVLLDGWRLSRGASLEHDIAVALGMDIFYPDEHYRLGLVAV